MRRRAAVAVAAATVLAVAAAVLVRLDAVFTYDVETQPVTFTSGENTLSGTLALPPGDGPFALVAFIHGDGPTTADHDGGYPPLWEALARAGHASLSWDKPGVGASTGAWERQTMAERADEVVAALDAVSGHPRLDPERLGLISFSQGGWPLPLVAAQVDVDLAVAVSPAISWRRQGRYDLDTSLAAQGATPVEVAVAHRYSDAERELMARGAPYREYLALAEQRLPAELERFDAFDPITRDRWRFASLNTWADATASLANLRATPVLLQLGGHDVHVDVRETERVYRRELSPACLEVARYPGADHSMLRADLADHPALLWVRSLWQPRDVFADGVLADIEAFARDHSCDPGG